MYLGRIVEEGARAGHASTRPLHPYTQLLRAASPVPDPKARLALTRIVGEVPSAANPPSGCTFHPRCARASERCVVEPPQLERRNAERLVACHHPETWDDFATAGAPA